MKLYVYDTQIDFGIDTRDAISAGNYRNAQNSGDWLEAAFLKQQSDEFKVYKSILPGAQTGNTYEPGPPDGGSPGGGIDFTSYAEISRGGDSTAYSYTVNVKIFDVHAHTVVASISRVTADLGQADEMIDACVGTFSPVPDQLRNYQKQLREKSGYTKWIGAKWKTQADKTQLKIHQLTTVHIKAFDCIDEHPLADQEITLALTNDKPGSLSIKNIKTNSSGEATVTFTAKDNGYTRVVPDFTFTDVNGKTGWHGTSCSDQEDIVVADDIFRIRMEAELTGPEKMHYKLIGECMAVPVAYADSTYGLRPQDGSKNMNITVITAGVPGKLTLVKPKTYHIPFVLNTGNLGKTLSKTAPATISIESFSPTEQGLAQSEYYQTPGGILNLPDNINSNFNAPFMKTAVAAGKENGAKARQDLPWIKRLRDNKNNPAYFNSPQGKADLQQMQKFSQEHGMNFPQIYANSQAPPKGASDASMAFAKGILNTQSDTSASHTAPNAYKPTVMGGLFHADGSFNPKNKTCMQIDKEEDISTIHGKVKITVEKIQ
jgi:hypothetical protein